jgi:uncharacterized protein
MPMHANALVVMAKAPIPGQVKTRLVPYLSYEEAAELYRCLLLDMLESLKRFRGADLFLGYSAHAWFDKIVPDDFGCVAQRGEDLGARMHNIVADIAAKDYRHVVIVGSDLPVFPSNFLEEAFSRLSEGKDVVLGPTRDGGYYLVGMSRPLAEVFQGIAWSGENVFLDTARNVARLGLNGHFLPAWFDIDTAEDLRELESMCVQLSVGSQPRTAQFLKGRHAK